MTILPGFRSAFLYLTFLSQLNSAAPLDPKNVLDLLLGLLADEDKNACVSSTEIIATLFTTVNLLKCVVLDRFLPGKVAFPTDLSYASSQATFWSAQEQSLRPLCIAIPTSTNEVSTAVRILNIGFQADIPGCKFAIRGAGYSFGPTQHCTREFELTLQQPRWCS